MPELVRHLQLIKTVPGSTETKLGCPELRRLVPVYNIAVLSVTTKLFAVGHEFHYTVDLL